MSSKTHKEAQRQFVQEQFPIGSTVTCKTGGSNTAKVVKVNVKTLVVELPSGDQIKRHIQKDNIQLVQGAGNLAASQTRDIT